MDGQELGQGSSSSARPSTPKGPKPKVKTKGEGLKCSHAGCGKVFTRRSDRVRHERIHSDDRRFVCTICSKAFIQLSALKVHTRTHTGEKPHECEVCQKTFADSSSLARHRKIHTDIQLWNCTACSKTFYRKEVLAKHLESEHEISDTIGGVTQGPATKRLVCSQCNKSFTRPGSLANHEASHGQFKGHKCRDCERVFDDWPSLARHRKIHHTSTTGHKCQECGIKFAQPDQLARHLATRHPYRARSSSPSSFSSLSGWSSNSLSPPPEPVPGPLSQKQFDWAPPAKFPELLSSVSTAQYSHFAPRKPRVVLKGVAGKFALLARASSAENEDQPEEAATRDEMDVDQEQTEDGHVDEEDEENELVSESDDEMSELDDEMGDNAGSKEFPCSSCGSSFNRRDNLRRHFSVHGEAEAQALLEALVEQTSVGNEDSEQRTCICSKCSKSFKRKDTLKKHLLTHGDEAEELLLAFAAQSSKPTTEKTTEPSHICSECGVGFHRRDHLKRHFGTHGKDKAKELLRELPPSRPGGPRDDTLDRPYSCSHEGCGASYTRRENLLRHFTTHGAEFEEQLRQELNAGKKGAEPTLVEKNFQCDQCSRFFSTSENLAKHVAKIHSGPIAAPVSPEASTDLSCSYCGGQFTKAKNLKIHIHKFHEALRSVQEQDA